MVRSSQTPHVGRVCKQSRIFVVQSETAVGKVWARRHLHQGSVGENETGKRWETFSLFPWTQSFCRSSRILLPANIGGSVIQSARLQGGDMSLARAAVGGQRTRSCSKSRSLLFPRHLIWHCWLCLMHRLEISVPSLSPRKVRTPVEPRERAGHGSRAGSSNRTRIDGSKLDVFGATSRGGIREVSSGEPSRLARAR